MQSASAGAVPSLSAIQSWADFYHITHPVLADTIPSDFADAEYYPQYVIINREMEVAHIGYLNESLIEDLL